MTKIRTNPLFPFQHASAAVSFHARLGRIREKIFRNDEAGALSFEGFLDAFDRIPLNASDPNDVGVKAEFKVYQDLMVNKADFEEVEVIGRGHFGTVTLVRERAGKNGRYYAMKRMAKGHVTTQSAQLERTIMARAKSDWLVKLKFAFQERKFLYLVMEYCPGGDLRSLLDR